MVKKRLLFLLPIAIFIFVGFILTPTKAIESTWLNSNLSLNEQETYSIPEENLDLNAVTGNKIGCIGKSFIIKPSIINNNYYSQHEQTKKVCAYGVTTGVYGDGYLLRNGTTVAGELKSSTSNYSLIIPIPGSDSVLELISAGGNAYKIYLSTNGLSRANAQIDSGTKSVRYTLPIASVNDALQYNGNVFYVDPNTITFSANGNWLLADGLNTGFLRINLTTKEVVSFAKNFSTSGNTVYSINAVTDDGRFALVGALAPYQKSDIYDLNTCSLVPGQTYLFCQKRDLQQYLTSERNLFYGVQSARFSNNNVLKFYATYDRIDTSHKKVGRFSLGINGSDHQTLDYLALGDSFSSGEGAYRYRPETNTNTNRCHQSLDSYGSLLGQTLLNNNEFHSIACSGARIKDIVLMSNSESYYNERDRQSDGMSDTDLFDAQIYENYLPGYRLQLNFVSKYQPRVATVSMGGNDIGFSKIVQKCVSPLTTEQICYRYYEDRKELVNRINNIYPALLDMYERLLNTSQSTRLYVIGYPQLAMANGNCASNVMLNNDEIVFSNQLITYLNSVIKLAANHAGAYYVDVEDAFAGHRLCETKSSNVAANGITIGRGGGPINNEYPFASESFHPNALGQSLLANKIASKTNNLTSPMPIKSTEPINFNDESSVSLLQNTPLRSGAIMNPIYDNDISLDTIYKNQPLDIAFSNTQYSLPPNTVFTATLYSTPTYLGAITTDSSGKLDGALNVPADVPAGYHTLHITGINILGEPIDVEKIVYVAETEDDIDGDGISDANEACVVVEPSGLDIDKDGVDDACDGFIDEPPNQTDHKEGNQGQSVNQTQNPANPTNVPVQQGSVTVDASQETKVAAVTSPVTTVAGTSNQQSQQVSATVTKTKSHNAMWVGLAILLFVGLGTYLLSVYKNKQSS